VQFDCATHADRGSCPETGRSHSRRQPRQGVRECLRRELTVVVAGVHPKRTADVDGDRGRTQVRQSALLAKFVGIVVPAESHWRLVLIGAIRKVLRLVIGFLRIVEVTGDADILPVLGHDGAHRCRDRRCRRTGWWHSASLGAVAEEMLIGWAA
jgi:hypothetical protein